MKTEHAADKGKIHACDAVTAQEGWTAERLMGYLDTKSKDGSFKEQIQAIAFDINATIVAEREKYEREKCKQDGWYEGRHHERRLISEEIQQLREQLSDALEQCEESRLLLATARQPLVDALHKLAMRVLQSDLYLQAKQETDDALLLAKVKEGK
jgi:uncharacterized membrane protein YheB (UPF0754 family)